MTSDQEFAAWLREARGAVTHEECVRIEERVARQIRQRDQEQGPYVPHEHRAYYGEARH